MHSDMYYTNMIAIKNLGKQFLIYYMLIIVFVCFNVACQSKSINEYQEKLIISKKKYNQIVIVLDFGCEPCKESFFSFAQNEWPSNTALIFRRNISLDTKRKHASLLNKNFVFFDSLDLAHKFNLANTNDQIIIIKENQVMKFDFLNDQAYLNIISDFLP
jgi:hypothetical protein